MKRKEGDGPLQHPEESAFGHWPGSEGRRMGRTTMWDRVLQSALDMTSWSESDAVVKNMKRVDERCPSHLNDDSRAVWRPADDPVQAVLLEANLCSG